MSPYHWVERLGATQIKALAVATAVLIVSLEVLALSHSFDAYQLIMHTEGQLGWRAIFGYFGQIAKLVVVFVFLLLVALHSRIFTMWHGLLDQLALSHFFWLIFAQLFVYSSLFYLSRTIFSASDLKQVPALYLFAWLVNALVWGLLTLVAVSRIERFVDFLKQEWRLVAVVALLAFAVWSIASLSTQFWGPLSEYTFLLAILLLALLSKGEIYADFENKDLGLSDFVVNIAPACSGYEGIGLVCSFTALYLYIHKHEFRFPQSWLLFPIGALFIWVLNVVRIVVLIVIGQHGSADVAVGGFHSQAGWITFILASLVMLWFASSVRFFAKPAALVNQERLQNNADNGTELGSDPGSDFCPDLSSELDSYEQPSKISSGPESGVSNGRLAVAALVPMVVLLASILITQALTADFNWLYPVRVLATLAALAWAWSKLGGWQGLVPSRTSTTARLWLEAMIAGLLVAAVWAYMLVGESNEFNQQFSTTLSDTSTFIALAWLCFRFIGSTITVPIAEELAFRAYLLCKLGGQEVSLSRKLPISIIAIVGSSLAFGFLHGAWLEGTFAGIVYAIIRLRSHHVGYAIFAHSLTNALLFAYAAVSGEWALL